jgi:hypothetical protein
MRFIQFLNIALVLARGAHPTPDFPFSLEKSCIVQPGGNASVDDAPAILEAFKTCGYGGRVVFLNTTYHVNSVMNTTGLKDCQVDLRGTLLVSLCTLLVQR